ncbi:MAG: hypothetical protein N2556_02480 [Anaerolineae bacterium]|nr:hypothetical protein [Anaerolineae bacterium]
MSEQGRQAGEMSAVSERNGALSARIGLGTTTNSFFRLPATGFRLPATDFRLPATGLYPR